MTDRYTPQIPRGLPAGPRPVVAVVNARQGEATAPHGRTLLDNLGNGFAVTANIHRTSRQTRQGGRATGEASHGRSPKVTWITRATQK